MKELETQKFLRTGNNSDPLAQLTDLYALNVRHHESLPLVILNYDQIESPRNVPVTNECRGLILEKGSWNIVAKSFNRFFNLGEFRSDDEKFEWNGSYAQDKEDGSLMTLFRYKNEYRWSTRGSFAEQSIQPGCKSWQEYCWDCINIDAVPGVFDSYGTIENRLTLIFEFCSPYNKIVRRYSAPPLFLLSAFDNFLMEEEERKTVDDIAEELGVKRPTGYFFSDVDHVQQHLEEFSQRDKTYEGVVLRDKSDKRLKIKTLEYLSLHRLHGNGNLFNVKNLIPFLWDKDLECEALAYFPEVRDNFEKLQLFYNGLMRHLENYWHCFHDEKNQKRFALSIKDCPCNGLLFSAKKLDLSLQDVIKTEQGRKTLTNYLIEKVKL